MSWRASPGTTRWSRACSPWASKAFPSYDLSLQFRTMQLLGDTDVPVPDMLWLEEDDTTIFGAPFYIMRQVAGRVPSDNPPYGTQGWLFDAKPEEQAQVWWGQVEALAKIHRLDYRAAGFEWLENAELGSLGLDANMAHYDAYFEWAACGREQPTLEAARTWLGENRPDEDHIGVVWGDSRIGNIIYDHCTPAAVVDWEMVTLGSHEEDLGWAIFLDRHHSEGIGVPRLPGFASYEETVERYQELSGFEVRHRHWHEVWAGFRFGCVMMRLAQQMHHYELMDEAASRNFELDNTVTRLTAQLLELPPPSEYTGGSSASSSGGFAPS